MLVPAAENPAWSEMVRPPGPHCKVGTLRPGTRLSGVRSGGRFSKAHVVSGECSSLGFSLKTKDDPLQEGNTSSPAFRDKVSSTPHLLTILGPTGPQAVAWWDR